MIDQVSLVSGVSAVLSAAFRFARPVDTLASFRQRFLIQDAEASLSTSVNVTNLVLLAKGGVNDRSGLPTWLDENLFHGATFNDVLRPGRPQLWINASDIYNRTTFIFNTVNFGALCSDLRRYPLSEAVAASAAVPFIFRADRHRELRGSVHVHAARLDLLRGSSRSRPRFCALRRRQFRDTGRNPTSNSSSFSTAA